MRKNGIYKKKKPWLFCGLYYQDIDNKLTDGLINNDSLSLIDIYKIEVMQSQHNDPLLRDIISKCELSSSNTWKDYKLNDNVLYYIDETLKN